MSTAIPSQQKAAVFPDKGEENKAEVRDWPVPQPKDDEVLIKITATAINPVDWKIRDMGYFVEKFPAVVGSDGAGEIAQVGSAVKDFQVGDRVFFQGILTSSEYSTFQQYAVMPAELVGRTPKSVSDEEAGGISLATMANIAGYYTKEGLDVKPHPWEAGGDKAGENKSIVILGGSSSVGQYAIQLARISGFSNIVTASSKSHHEYLKSLGAHIVLDRNTASASDYVEAAKAYPLGAVVDSISEADTGILAVDILKTANPEGVDNAEKFGIENSTAVFFLQPDDKVVEAAKSAGSKANIQIHNVWGIGSAPHLRSNAIQIMKALGGEDGYLAKGTYKPNRPHVIKGGLASVEEALQKNKKGISGLKIIVKPQEGL